MKKAVVVFITVFFSWQNYAQNILNGGFENGFSNWTPVGTAQFSADSNNPHSGSASGKIISNLPHGGVAAFGQNVSGVTAGKTYEYQYWVRMDSTITQYIYSFIKFQNGANEVYQTGNTPCGYQPGWMNVKYRFKVPPNTNNVLLGLCISGTGTVWFDDVALTEITDTAYSSFSMDLQSDSGVFKKLFSTNVGPTNSVYIPKFQEMGIEYVRTHDYHTAFDFHIIFPDTSRSPSDSLAYKFGSTDSAIAQIINAGCNVFFRLGESYGYTPSYMDTTGNFGKWAQVAVQIVKHYNDGWDKGFHYNIQYWEIWNEPNLPAFWLLSTTDYINFYCSLSNAIKQYNPGLKVGGPTLSTPYETKWMNDFLDSVHIRHAPLDFLSFHWYDFISPYSIYRATNQTRQTMTAKGFGSTELILDEWNPYSYVDSISNATNWGRIDALNSASTVSGYSYLQESSLDKLFRYATDMYDFPLLQWSGAYTYQGYAYKMLNQLANMNTRLAVVGSDTLGTVIMAARSASSATAIIADNSSKAGGYTLSVNGINSNEILTYQITRLDSANLYTVVKSGTVNSVSNNISVQVRSPYVDYIEFTGLTGVNGPDITNQFFIYPNPTTGMIHISSTNIAGQLITIYDMCGQKEMEINYTGNIDVNQLAPGVYIIEIKGPNGVAHSQFSKI